MPKFPRVDAVKTLDGYLVSFGTASANRVLTVGTSMTLTGGANKTLTLTEGLTSESASTVNQDLTTDANVQFAGTTVTSITI